ncbi:MAG: DUF3426 domain-containing protein [Gammaproteobacteria bacterium]
MYTRCPHCTTVFRVTAEQLRAADGDVRCGRCQMVFSALDALYDDPPEESVEVPSLDQAWARTSAELGLAEMDLATAPAPPDGSADEAVIEVSKPDVAQEDTEDEEVSIEVTENTEGILWIDVAEDRRIVPRLPTPDIEQKSSSVEQPAPMVPIDERAHPPPELSSTDIDPHELFGEIAEPPKRRRIGWIIASAALLFMLLTQAVHYQRHELLRHQQIGVWLEKVYGVFGMQVAPDWSVADYDIAKLAATNEPAAPGTLVVQAHVTNNAVFPQPYPLIKLTLYDRWGDSVGERSFEPPEYMSESPTARLMASGEDLDASMTVLIPNEQATNYELDVCLRVDAHMLRCANE